MNDIYYGDCLKLLPYFQKESVDMILSDIPYGIDLEDWDVKHSNKNSALGGASPAQNKSFKRRGKPLNGWSDDDKLNSYEYQVWCHKVFIELERITKPGSPIIIFSSRRLLHRVMIAGEDAGLIPRDVLIWKKSKAHGKAQRLSKVLKKRGLATEPWQDYRLGNLKPMYEPFVWFMKRYKGTITDCILNNQVGGFNSPGTDIKSNIFEFDRLPSENSHPTQKPLSLFEDIINTFSRPGAMILDPFVGAATTSLAAKNTNRHSIGIEINQEYVKIGLERLSNKHE